MLYTVSLKKNVDFKRLYSRGKSKVTPCLAAYCRMRRGCGNRLGITVSTKLGKAVFRNRLRRRIREAYRLHEEEFIRGFDLVVVARTRAAHVSFAELERALMTIADKLEIKKK